MEIRLKVSNIPFFITIHNVFFFVDSKSCISVCIQINIHMNSFISQRLIISPPKILTFSPFRHVNLHVLRFKRRMFLLCRLFCGYPCVYFTVGHPLVHCLRKLEKCILFYEFTFWMLILPIGWLYFDSQYTTKVFRYCQLPSQIRKIELWSYSYDEMVVSRVCRIILLV
jgi:hypothetical protein